MKGETLAVDPSPDFGRYRVLGEIGRGASGTVYRALDTLIGREVAIKSFRQALREDLLREARSAGMLSHPNVVTLYDVVEAADGSFFIAMEYVHGRSLADLLAEDGPPDFERAVDWVSQVASALDYLHSMGLVHRDVKPANILITDTGRVKLTDFGIAVPGTGEDPAGGEAAVLGTPNYMAPEQILGHEVTPRSDVWSLGVVLYEALTGRRPFEERTVAEVVHRVVHAPAPPPGEESDLPDGVRPLLERALAKDPRWRFPSAGELARELRQVLYRAAAAAAEDTSEREMLERTLVTHALSVSSGASTPAPVSPSGGRPSTAGVGRAAAPAGVLPWTERAARTVRRLVSRPASAARPDEPRGTAPGDTGILQSLRRRVPGPAAAVAGVLLAVVLAALVYMTHRWLDLGTGAPVELEATETALEGPSLEALRILREGRRLLAAGDAEGAALFFEVVERMEPNLPDPERIARMRRASEAEAREQAVELEAARTALADREARELVASARRRVPTGEGEGQAREARTALAVAGETLAAAGPTSAEPAGAADGDRVRVEFTSDSPEGAVTLYANGRQLLRRGFSYYHRTWWLGRSPSTGGFEQDLTLPPRAGTLWIYVARAEGPAQRLEVPARHPRGAQPILRIHLPAAGEATAAWE